MPATNINVGTIANDGTGDTLIAAFQIVNANFDDVDTFLTSQVTTVELNAATALLVTIVDHDADIANLQSQIDDRAGATHSHVISDVTGLQTALDAKASTSTLNSQIASLNSTIAAQNVVIADLITRIEALEA